jgi:phosphatidate cytidylyltransferase
VLEPLSLTTFAFAYLGVLLSFVVQLRLLGPGGSQGIVALASLLIVTKLSDIGAYTVGRLVGRHKLAPLLSPGKTIEGTIGGLLFAQLGAWFCGAFLVPELAGPSGGNRGGWAIFGLAVGFFAIAGDLAESLLKRDAQRKDSSTWMPGFGGILDILDSILVAAPAAYLCWLIGLVGP